MKKIIFIMIVSVGLGFSPLVFASYNYSGYGHVYHFSSQTRGSTGVDLADQYTSPLSANPILSGDNNLPVAESTSPVSGNLAGYSGSWCIGGGLCNPASNGQFTNPVPYTQTQYVQFWFNTDNASAQGFLDDGSGGTGIWKDNSGTCGAGNYFALYDVSGGTQAHLCGTNWTTGVWHMFALSWESASSSYAVYLDGVEVNDVNYTQAHMQFSNVGGGVNFNASDQLELDDLAFGDTPVSSADIASIYNGGVGQQFCVSGDTDSGCSGTPPVVGSSSISLIYPFDGLVTPPISYFGYQVNNPTSGLAIFNFQQVATTTPTSTFVFTQPHSVSQGFYWNSNDLATSSLYQRVFTGQLATGVWIVQPAFTPNGGNTVQGSMYEFQINNQLAQGTGETFFGIPLDVSTSSLLVGSVLPFQSAIASSSLGSCIIGTNWTCDVGLLVQTVAGWLFVPSNDAIQGAQASIATVQSTAPFDLFTNLSSVVQQVANNISSTPASSTYDTLSFNQSTTFLGNAPIVMLTSSSMASFIGEPAKEDLFRDEKYGLWLLWGMLVAISIYHKVSNS